MAYNERNRYRENGVSGYSQSKVYPMMPHPLDVSKYDPRRGRADEGPCAKTGPLPFAHSILEPGTELLSEVS